METESFVYFIRAGNGPVKIGRSSDPARRLASLQTAHYKVLVLLFTVCCPSVESAVEIEAAFHRWYGDKRINNEWSDIPVAKIEQDLRLLGSLSKHGATIKLHVSVKELEAINQAAEKAAYRKAMNAREIIRSWFTDHPERVDDNLDILHRDIVNETGHSIGRTSIHNVRKELKETK